MVLEATLEAKPSTVLATVTGWHTAVLEVAAEAKPSVLAAASRVPVKVPEVTAEAKPFTALAIVTGTLPTSSVCFSLAMAL